jgi:hypothetical protein
MIDLRFNCFDHVIRMSRWLVLENCAFVLVPWNLIIILICRLDGVHEQIGHLHRLIHGPLSKDFDYLLSAQNLKKAEVEVCDTTSCHLD